MHVVTRLRYTDRTIRVKFLADRILLLPVPLTRDKGAGFEVLKGESVAYHVLQFLDVEYRVAPCSPCCRHSDCIRD